MSMSGGLRVAFRVDASLQIGTGHLMRCLSLASELARRGATCFFMGHLVRPLADQIEAQGHHRIALPVGVSVVSPVVDSRDEPPHAAWLAGGWANDAAQTLGILGELGVDWLVVDHYALAAPWEAQVRTAVRRLLVIDDLADRSHICDLLLDFNAYPDASTRYRRRVANAVRCLFGPRYALLRSEFFDARRTQPPFLHRQSLFIGFGGADAGNLTLRSLRAARELCSTGIPCDVVVGPTYPFLDELRGQLSEPAFHATRLHVATRDMAFLMGRARMAVCGGGVSTWERLCMGLPSLVLSTADNQVEALAHLHVSGWARVLGKDTDVSDETLKHGVDTFWRQTDLLAEMSTRCAAVVDGAGCERVADAMFGMGPARVVPNPSLEAPAPGGLPVRVAPVFLAPLETEHIARLTVWKNDPDIAHQIAAHPNRHSEADVQDWLVRTASDPNQILLGIFEPEGAQVVGVARLMYIDWISGVAELGIFIGETDLQGRGHGRVAVSQLLGRAFGQHGLQRVHLKVMSDNAAAIRCYEACGFVHEGRLREHFMSRGVRYDMLVMGILRGEHGKAMQAS